MKAARLSARVQLLGSGAILREVMAAADILAEQFEVCGRYLECHQLY